MLPSLYDGHAWHPAVLLFHVCSWVPWACKLPSGGEGDGSPGHPAPGCFLISPLSLLNLGFCHFCICYGPRQHVDAISERFFC